MDIVVQRLDTLTKVDQFVKPKSEPLDKEDFVHVTAEFNKNSDKESIFKIECENINNADNVSNNDRSSIKCNSKGLIVTINSKQVNQELFQIPESLEKELKNNDEIFSLKSEPLGEEESTQLNKEYLSQYNFKIDCTENVIKSEFKNYNMFKSTDTEEKYFQEHTEALIMSDDKFKYENFQSKEDQLMNNQMTKYLKSNPDVKSYLETERSSSKQTSLNINSYSQIESNITSEKIPMFQCNQCPHKAKRNFDLKIHMKIHMKPEEIEMYQCSQCSYRAKRKNDLNVHRKVHMDPEDIPVYQCSHCSYWTKLRSSIKRHMKIHMKPEDIKMYQCNKCFYKSKHKSNLKSHMKTHLKPETIKLFQCSQCFVRFKVKSSLNRHMKTHMNSGGVDRFP